MPSGERRPLEHAHRPVPEHGACAADLAREPLSRLGADVEPEPAVRERIERRDLRLGTLVERRGGDDVGREHRLVRKRLRVAQLLRHLPADEHGVGSLPELAENAELVLDLRAARNEDERSLDVGEEAAEHLELLLEQ